MGVRERCERIKSDLLLERSHWDQMHRDIARYLVPNRTVWDRSERGRGDRKDRQVHNNTPLLAIRVLSAGLMAGVTSPAREWFTLGLEDEDLAKHKPVRVWLEQTREIIQGWLHRSSWYRALSSAAYPDLSSVAVTAMGQELSDGKMRFLPFAIGEYALGVDQYGTVDTCVRDELRMSVRQLVGRFGRDNLSQAARNAWDRGNYHEQIPVNHIVLPAEEHKGGIKDRPYVSYWWESASDRDTVLSEKGYHEFPILAPRWSTVTTSDAYGRGPGWDVLGDVRMLQLHEMQMLTLIDKMVDPPTWFRGVKRGSIIPGAQTYLGTNETAAAGILQTVDPMAIRVLREQIAIVENRINEGLYQHLWAMLLSDDRAQRPTATEVEARRQEVALQLGPLLESINDELLEPVIERTFSLLERHGEIPEPPPELEGMPVKIEFHSILQSLQQSHGLISTRALVQEIRMIAEIRPDVLDKLDVDVIADELQRVTGARADSLLDQSEVDELRRSRQEQAMAQQQGDAMAQAAEAVRNLGQTDTTTLAELANAVGPVAAAQGGALGRMLG